MCSGWLQRSECASERDHSVLRRGMVDPAPYRPQRARPLTPSTPDRDHPCRRLLQQRFTRWLWKDFSKWILNWDIKGNFPKGTFKEAFNEGIYRRIFQRGRSKLVTKVCKVTEMSRLWIIQHVYHIVSKNDLMMVLTTKTYM